MKTKIELSDSMQDVVVKMSEGNPGAVRVCCELLKDGAQIDPDSALGGFGAILALDSLGLYGSKIWMLYKDVCDCNLALMLAVLRGHQLSFLSKSELLHAVENNGAGIDLDGICVKVFDRLPHFDPAKLIKIALTGKS